PAFAFSDRGPALAPPAALVLARAVVEAAGVHKREPATPPLDGRVEAIPCGARLVLDDGDTVTDQAIEEGRLSHVGTADHGDKTTAHPHTLRRRVAATPRKRLLSPDVARIVASLDKGRERAGAPLPRVTAATESVPLLFA